MGASPLMRHGDWCMVSKLPLSDVCAVEILVDLAAVAIFPSPNNLAQLEAIRLFC